MVVHADRSTLSRQTDRLETEFHARFAIMVLHFKREKPYKTGFHVATGFFFSNSK